MIYFAESKYTKVVMKYDPKILLDIECDATCQETNKNVDKVLFYYTLKHKEKWSPFLTILAVIINIGIMVALIRQFIIKVSIVGFKSLKKSLLVVDAIYFIINSITIIFIIFHNVFDRELPGKK